MSGEFDKLSDMSDQDAVVYLMTLSKEYETIAEEARKRAYTIMTKEGYNMPEFISKDGFKVRVVNKQNTKVDVDALRVMYPDIYKEICDSGEISVKQSQIKKYPVQGVTSTTFSNYVEMRKA